MAVKVRWTGNAANLPKERKNDATPTVRYVGMGSGGNTYQPYAKPENNTARTVTVENTAPEAQSGGKGFFKRAGLTVSGGAKGSLAGNMDAMGVAYEAGQGGRTQRYTDELREAQWAVARAKHDYDADPGNQLGKNTLDTAITKMKAFADTLGKGAYEQALTAAYDVAAKLDTGDLKALYNGLGVVTPEKGTGTQQKAASAARDLAYEVQKSASEDLQRAKEGASKFGQMLVDAGASMTQMGLDTAANALMGTQGTMIPFATRAFGGSTMDARQDGADLKGQALYGGAQAAKEVFTEKMFNIALPFAKAYGKGGLDQVVENGIHKAAEKLGKSDIGRAALEKVLKFGASAASEGLEEFVGDFMEWQMPRIYGGDTDSLAETFSNALYDFAVGTISGAAGGAVGNVMDSYNESVQARETEKAYAGREQELLDESKELNPGNDLAKKYQERLDNGKKLSGRQLMRLIEQNETDAVAGDKAKIQSAAEGRLTQLGETGDAAQIAQAITKQVAGEKLSTAEQSLIDESRYGRRVANEIDPENVKAVVTKDGITPRDTFASEWTGKLDTKRIYPEVFNRLMPQPQKTKEVTARQKGEVTGAKYNAETGRLDAIVTNEAGKVKTVPAAEAEMTPMQEELFDWADELKLEAAGPLMVRAYQPEQNMELYTRSFKLAYEYGKAGMPMDYVEKSEGVNYLHPTQIKLAYEEGQAATQRKVQAREEKIRSGGTADSTTKKKGSVSLRGAKVGSKTYAPVKRKTVDSRQWASVKAMRAFSRAVGVDVVFYQSQANERGVYKGANGFYKGGKLYLDINAGRDTVGMTETAILKTAAHELTHFIQANSAQYEALKSFVVNKLTHEEGVSFEDLVADKQRREPGLEYDEAVDEVVADACEMMLGDSTVVEQLAKENRSLAEKIRDWLREWVENLKIALEGLQADRTESRAMLQYARELQEIWDNALMDAARNNRGTVEAESRQQASPRKKYWRPDLAENEWRLLERRMSEEIGSRENFLDEATKWVYANEKGVQVFALYGIGDGTDATPLYAVGGEKAAAAAADMQKFVNGGYHYDKGTGTALSRIRGFLRTQGDGGGDIRETSRGGSAGTDDALYGGERKGNAGKSAERGSEDQRGVKEKFSMREPVEETRDLLALHNMTMDNLRGALKLGGLPMPSIAIVKAKSGHDQYGPISLVFRKDTIDPQLFRDAWTPTAPRIEYEVNEKAADKLRELYYRMQREKGRDFAAPLYSVANTLEDELNNKGGLDKVVDTMRDDTRIMQIYLEDTGAGSVANVMRKNVTRMSEGEIEMAQALTEKLGEKTIQSISAQTGESPFSARRRWFAKYGEAVNDALTAYYEQEGIPHEEALRAVEAETTANKIKSVLLARKYLNGNAEVITEEVDREATDKAIREKVNQDSYDQWLEGLFSGVVKNSGIYNGKDYYTASGNRRSFSATHYEVNLENTVRAMKQGDQTGVGTFFGGQAIWGVTAKDYRSIEEIKEDSGRLQKLSEEEYSQIRQQFTERLADITSEIMDKNNGNEFTASDDAASAIVETLRTKHTVKAIDKELRTYPTLRIQPDTAQKVFDLCRDISNMPTGYFEAKPQRAVGFDEAAAVVVPDNLPADLRKGLEQIGATVREYKAGDEQSRLEAVNADERVRFSVRESFSKEIDSWARDGMPEGVRFTLGSTGPVLQGLGAIESDIYMEGDKIKKILQDHPEMTLAEIKKVPQILEDPALILKSEGRGKSGANSRLVCFGLTKAQNGQPVMTVMDLRPRENGFVVDDMQKVNSAYTKKNPMAFIQKSDVVYADKKRAIPLLRTTGLTISSQRLLQNGYIGSISYKGSSVNIEGVPFSSVVKIEMEDKAQNQQRDPRLSDRDVLRMAADMAQRDRSQRWSVEDLNRFDLLQRKLLQLDEANAELEALKEERKVLLAGRKVKELTRDEQFDLAQNRNRTETQKSKIQRLEEETYKIESVPQVKALLKKSRSIVERAADSKARAEFREAREKQEVLDVTRRKVERNAKRLLEYMNTNTDKKHIPEALKKPIGELLESLDFYSNSARKGGNKTRADQRYCEAMQGLQSALAAQKLFDDTGEGTDLFKGYLDLPAGFESMLGVHVERVKTAMEKHPLKTDIVRKMDLDDLRDLDVILSVMSRSVTQMNEMFVNRRFAYVADAAEDSIESMDRLGQHQDKAKGAEQFALWDNTLPWYAFQRFGEGGKAVFEGLQDGWDKLAFNMKTVLDFRQELIKDTVARKWDTETHKVELTDPDGATVTATLTTAQLMSLYCLSKRKQALGHLLGGGIRPAAIELTDTLGDRVRKRSLTQDKQYKLTDESLGQLLKLLTPEQKKIADAMQKFMTEQGSAWGNAVTMARFGYRGFTEQNYFPIETDAQDRQAKTGDTKEGSLYRLQNISAVKPLVKNANNALILRGIFDVFANHTADMAKYNAMVLPIIDAQKWYNYKYASKNEAGQVSTRTVQRAMTRAYGGAANSFVIKYMQDLNGVKESGDRGDTLPKKMISNYKRAMVAANMRVALLQPTAYVRASAVLDYKYLVKAFADKTSTKQATKEMLENSGIALWKSLGFFDTDVGRSVRDQIKGKSGKLENLVDKTMIPAEKGDEITWARLWRACKLEVQDKQSLTGDELLKATAERFREVVYRTQVVDSTMTRSHMMRGSGTLSKMTTSFMSEPTVSYNMVMESTRQIAEDAKRLGMRVALRRNWKVAGRAYQAYIVSAVVTAIVESLYDALRDSDDDDYLDKVWKAFGGEKPETVKDGILNVIFGLNGNLAGDINPIGKVPYLRDVVSILGGYSNGRMDTEAVANLKKAVDIWDEVIRLQSGDLDKATKTTYYGNMTTYGMIYPTAKALSQLTGLPGSAAMREIVTVWNSTVGAAWPNLKRRTYENKQLREAWEKYGKASGVSYAVMYRVTQDTKDFESDKDADGNTISGSLKAKYVEYIRSLGLPRAQEKAVWEAAKVSSWSGKGTPWG